MNSRFIGYLINRLGHEDFRKASEDVKIAKGKYELPLTWKAFKNKLAKGWL